MILEEALKSIDEKEDQIDKLKEEISDLRKNLINITPFTKGEKVKVIQLRNKFYKEDKDKEIECFITGVDYTWGKTLKYQFNKIKKDGTISAQSAGIYGYDKIEKI
jgi:hypothetical protein